MRQAVERHQSRRQRAKLPKGAVLVLRIVGRCEQRKDSGHTKKQKIVRARESTGVCANLRLPAAVDIVMAPS